MNYYDSSDYSDDDNQDKKIFNRQQSIRANYIMNYTKHFDIDYEEYSILDSKLFWFCLGCCLGNLRNE